jgi:hypothetical protein
MSNLSTPSAYKPVMNSRRSEVLAWIFSICIVLVLFVLPSSGFFRIAGFVLATFFTFSAIVMSLGNWVSRKTELRMYDEFLWLDNGIRVTTIRWEDIDCLEVFPGRFNDKIIVNSDSSNRLSFDVIKANVESGEAINIAGFKERDIILEMIIKSSGLNEKRKDGQQGYYYSKD